jgi:hypothetical protein
MFELFPFDTVTGIIEMSRKADRSCLSFTSRYGGFLRMNCCLNVCLIGRMVWRKDMLITSAM